MGPTARAERAVARQPGRSMPLRLVLRIFAIVLGWYAVSISIIFTNKYLLSTRDFRFPFFLTFCNNAIVSVITHRHGVGRLQCHSRRACFRLIASLDRSKNAAGRH